MARKLVSTNSDNKRTDGQQNKKTVKKDKLKLISENQRLVRENPTVEFKYKPKACKTMKEFQEMLRNEKKNTILPNCQMTPVNHSSKTNTNTKANVTSTKEVDDIVPLRDRIKLPASFDKTMNYCSPQAEKIAPNRKSLDVILREKYGARPSFVELKTSAGYKADKLRSEQLMQRIKENCAPCFPPSTKDLDILVKEKTGANVVLHHVTVKRQFKCVRIGGEIDPMLSKGVESLLSEEERAKWLNMSSRDRWKKHRSLLLIAESEKHRAQREERIAKANQDEKRKQDKKVPKIDNNGLSEDDYEWNADDESNNSNSSLESDSEATDPETEEEDFQEGRKVKKKILSDDEEEDKTLMTSNSFSSGEQSGIDHNFDFVDIPAHSSVSPKGLISKDDDYYGKSFSNNDSLEKSLDGSSVNLRVHSMRRNLFNSTLELEDDDMISVKSVVTEAYEALKISLDEISESTGKVEKENKLKDLDDYGKETKNTSKVGQKLDKDIELLNEEMKKTDDFENEENGEEENSEIEERESEEEYDDELEEEGNMDDDEEERLAKDYNKEILAEFIDSEAELSGSDAEEYGPDENETGLDAYEEELGDLEELPSEGNMRRQIGKLHNRMELDKDLEDIRYLKELYLEDGDLHLSDQGPRKKRFTWAGIDDQEFNDVANGANVEEEEEDEMQQEDEEEYLELKSNEETTGGDEASKLLMERLGHFLEAPKSSAPTSVTNTAHMAWGTNDLDGHIVSSNTGLVKPPKRMYGSFMNKPLPIVAPSKSSVNHMSLKARMQQHTFTVIPRNNTAANENVKRTFDSSSRFRDDGEHRTAKRKKF